jgi:hypothetical protein
MNYTEPGIKLQVFHDRLKVKTVGMKKKTMLVRQKTERGPVQELSRHSAMRLELVTSCMEPFMESFITLTYPNDYPSDGETVKKHLHKMLVWLKWYGVENYLWTLEFQKRGAPHYHIITDYFINHSDLAAIWFKIVGSGDELHLSAGTQIKAVRSKKGLAIYMKKYIRKQKQKDVPEEYSNVGRFWGHNRDLVKPLREVTYKAKGQRTALGSIRPLRKLNQSKRRRAGRSPMNKGEKARTGFTLRTKHSGGLLNQFMDYNDGRYTLELTEDKLK